MLKLSRNGIGLLTAQYRSVLRKCFILNMCAAGIAIAFAGTANAWNPGDIVDSADYPTLTTQMGNLINYDTTTDIAGMYLSGTYSSELYNIGLNNDAWIQNYEGQLVVGRNSGGSAVTTVISNLHNITGDSYTDGGGAIFNGNDKTKDIAGGEFSVYNSTFSRNSVSTDGFLYPMAAGGAIANVSRTAATITGTNFTENYAMSFTDALGGAIYNGTNTVNAPSGAQSAYGNITSSGNTFTSNHAGNISGTYAGYTIDYVPSWLVTSWQTDNPTVYANQLGMAKNAAGGAVYNGGELKKATFTSTNDTFKNNFALGLSAKGGAIANYSTITVTNGTLDSNAAITVYAPDAGLTEANALGGAFYNENDSTTTAQIIDSAITNNKVAVVESTGGYTYNAFGGAIYNNGSTDTANLAIKAQNADVTISGNGITVVVADDSAVENFRGGAIYNGNQGKLDLTSSGTHAININSNSAKEGGALYNAGTVNVTAGDTSAVNFNGNSATDNGGALYNAAGANFNATLTDAGKIVFNTSSDSVYNLGTITITGANTAPAITLYRPNAIDTTATQVVLNSEFGGTGTYNISTTQLNLGTSGLINLDPVMVLKNNYVNMADGSKIYLSSADTVNNNNFYLSSGALLDYTDTNPAADVTLANTIENAGTVKYAAATGDTDINIATVMKNSGVLNVADGLLTNVNVGTLNSANGNQIVINLDNPNLKADVITVADKISGTTNVKFVDMTNADISQVTLGEDDKIYFAKTQTDQSYNFGKTFLTNAANDEYKIVVGHEQNGSVYDWFLHRYKGLLPEEIAMIDLPRAAIEQTRSILFNVSRTNRGQCSCYEDRCQNSFCRYESGDTKTRLWATPFYRSGTYDSPVETDFKLKGIDFGLDIQPTHSDMFGVFGSYRDGKYENDGKGKKYSTLLGGSELDIKSMVAGLYYRRYFGNLYFLGAGYGGKLDIDMKADTGAKASTDGLNLGLQGELGYDIKTSNRSILTPSLRATYDYLKFDDAKDNNGRQYEYDKVHEVELEAALKFEYQFNDETQLPTSAYIKPSVIQTIASGGKVTINGTEYDKTVDNDTLGRIEIGADTEIIEDLSLGLFGNYTFGSEYKAWGVGGNVRYVW